MTKAKLVCCTLAIVACTIVSQPELPPGEKTARVYVLTQRSPLNWIGIVDHVAIVLPTAGDWLVQYGFGDYRYMASTSFLTVFEAARLMTFGLIFPSRGTIQRRSLGPLVLQSNRKEREAEVAARAGMRAMELELVETKVSELQATLETVYRICEGTPTGMSELTPIADRKYHMVFENCQTFVADWLAVAGLDTGGFRLFPRLSFWFVSR